jgi:NitT/TauT family transport system substrate-binding protein
MTTSIRLALAVVLVAAGALIADRATAEPLRIGHSTWVGYGPLYIAQEQGYYTDEGIEVELSVIEDTSARMAAMNAGHIEALATTIDTMPLYLTADIRMQYVFTIDDSTGGDGIVANKDITSIEDLRGKRVAFNAGTVSEFYITYLLGHAEMSISDIEHVNMDQADAGAAFVAERVDAAVTWEPWLSRARDTEHGHVLIDTSANPGLVVDVLLAPVGVIEARVDDFRALYRAWNRAVDFVKTNPDEAHEIMARGVGGWLEDPKIFAETLAGVSYYDQQRNEAFWGTRESPGAMRETVAAALEVWGGVDRLRVDVEAIDLINFDVVGQ